VRPKLRDVPAERASLDLPLHPLEHIAICVPMSLGPEQATLLDGVEIGVPKLLDEGGLDDAAFQDFGAMVIAPGLARL
jgi:hypothetical protein